MRKLRTPFGLVMVGALVWASLSCAPTPPPAEPGFRVRLLTAVAVSGRWEREAERGLGLIAAELDADIARSRASGTADQRDRLRALAAEGIDLIFCVGPEVESLVYTEAVAFPDTDFVIIPGDIQRANVASIAFAPEEAGFLAGAVAASLAEQPLVGVLRGAGRPWLDRLEAGFVAGFRATYPNAGLATARGPDGPWQLVQSGVRVALFSTDTVDPQVLAAVHDAGLSLVSPDPALMEAEPDVVVAAVDVDVAEAMLRVAREVHDRSFTGQVFAFDLGSGVVDLVLGPELDSGIDGDLHEVVERARSEITAGWVEIEELGIGR